MKQKTSEFIEKLAQLCTEYGAGFGYTTDDDGVHVEMIGDDVNIGFPSLPDPGEYIRKHAVDLHNASLEK